MSRPLNLTASVLARLIKQSRAGDTIDARLQGSPTEEVVFAVECEVVKKAPAWPDEAVEAIKQDAESRGPGAHRYELRLLSKSQQRREILTGRVVVSNTDAEETTPSAADVMEAPARVGGAHLIAQLLRTIDQQQKHAARQNEAMLRVHESQSQLMVRMLERQAAVEQELAEVRDSRGGSSEMDTATKELVSMIGTAIGSKVADLAMRELGPEKALALLEGTKTNGGGN